MPVLFTVYRTVDPYHFEAKLVFDDEACTRAAGVEDPDDTFFQMWSKVFLHLPLAEQLALLAKVVELAAPSTQASALGGELSAPETKE